MSNPATRQSNNTSAPQNGPKKNESVSQNGPKPSKPEVKPTVKEKQEEEEFQIAADLTLYANPLRCLQTKKNHHYAAKTKEKAKTKEEEAEESGEIIAADLTKYGSPLDDD